MRAYVARAGARRPERGYRLPVAGEIMREHCPFCGARKGEPCRSKGDNRIMAAFHAKRMRLAAYVPTD